MAEQGFGLILIDSDQGALEEVSNDIHDYFVNKERPEPQITKVLLLKFDYESV